MKSVFLHSPSLVFATALLVMFPALEGQCDSDAPRKNAKSNERPRAEKGEKRRGNAALRELREALEETRLELKKARDSLHEAHTELGLKAESISSLESKLSSVTAQLEKAKEDLKSSGASAETMAKQERQLEAGRKKITELQAEIKAMEKKTSGALAAVKKSSRDQQPLKTGDAKAGASKKTPDRSTAKTPMIAPIFYDAASAVNYPERDRALREVADALAKIPSAKVEITGHADDSRYAQTNDDVSSNRAKFLAAYFVLNGILEERIVARGIGNASPLKGQTNRRVEITIVP